jgi:hypothetical protein
METVKRKRGHQAGVYKQPSKEQIDSLLQAIKNGEYRKINLCELVGFESTTTFTSFLNRNPEIEALRLEKKPIRREKDKRYEASGKRPKRARRGERASI